MPMYETDSTIKEIDLELRRRGYNFNDLKIDVGANWGEATMSYKKNNKKAEIRLYGKVGLLGIAGPIIHINDSSFESSSLKLRRIDD